MKSHYYVYRVGYSKPTIRHATIESATAESLRLSAQHPGEVFEILQCLGMSQTTTAATFWADGCGLEAEIPWITHNGGPMPCEAGQRVEVSYRECASNDVRLAANFRWNHLDLGGDIMRWRPAPPTKHEPTASQSLTVEPGENPWIDHDGGDMPCEEELKVEVTLQDWPRSTVDLSKYFRWRHNSSAGDILTWRPVKPNAADDWIIRTPTDPIPKTARMVRFADGGELKGLINDSNRWADVFWQHTTDSLRNHITHYKK